MCECDNVFNNALVLGASKINELTHLRINVFNNALVLGASKINELTHLRLNVFNTSIVKTDNMITGEIKNRIDKIWDAFWIGGITNSITVLEQMTYLFFMKMLDDAQVGIVWNQVPMPKLFIPK